MQSIDTNQLNTADLKASAGAHPDDTKLNTSVDFVLVEAFDKKIIGTFSEQDEAVKASIIANSRSAGDAEFLVAKIVGSTRLGVFTARAEVEAPVADPTAKASKAK